MQVYCKNYKQAPTTDTHHLLRKARRLDQILNAEGSLDSDSTQSLPDPRCSECQTEFSPCFWPSSYEFEDRNELPLGNRKAKREGGGGGGGGGGGEETREWLCHRCITETDIGLRYPKSPVTNGDMMS